MLVEEVETPSDFVKGSPALFRIVTEAADRKAALLTIKRQVAGVSAEEHPTLGELLPEPFRFYRCGERTVDLDGCIEIEAAHHGAPPG
jgi:hypothetical protein